VLDEQHSGRAIFERLGFRVEGTLSKHARDRLGHYRDLLVLAYHVR
jgi:RimJ/RimL family protein N-acetyltransferase